MLKKKAEAIIRDIGRADRVFTINRNKAAFIVVDMQNFVCKPKKSPKKMIGIKKVVTNINRIADLCRRTNIPVIWIRQNFTMKKGKSDGGLYDKFHKTPLSREITNRRPGTEIYKELHFDGKKDHVVFKNRYSAFESKISKLDNLLKKLGKKQLIFAGAAVNVCVESTIRDAMQKGYEATLVSDATTTFDKALLEASLFNIKIYFGDVLDTAGVLKELA